MTYNQRKNKICKACACRDCGKRGGLYMLKTKVWLKIWPTYYEDMENIIDPDLRHGMLCIECAEKRFGRSFKPGDFMPGVPCNDVIFYAFRSNKKFNKAIC